jgi:hypothetical protein
MIPVYLKNGSDNYDGFKNYSKRTSSTKFKQSVGEVWDIWEFSRTSNF